MFPSISIVTAVRNSATTLKECLISIQSQTYPIEHIIIDGASNDNTHNIINCYRAGISKIVSEPDQGIYDAMNKGIALATGDIVGILNADDYYINEHVIAKIAEMFDVLSIDALFADLVFVRPGNLDKLVRYYSGANFTLSKLAFGWMPPHPTFFVKRECYEKYGLFKTDYRIAADFELLARFLFKHRILYHYLPEVIIKMRTGGTSTKSLRSNVILNREILRACAENNIKTNIFKIYSKYFTKCIQLVSRPS
jgi:glycosyltransferase involved in cell wall biosynthesis